MSQQRQGLCDLQARPCALQARLLRASRQVAAAKHSLTSPQPPLGAPGAAAPGTPRSTHRKLAARLQLRLLRRRPSLCRLQARSSGCLGVDRILHALLLLRQGALLAAQAAQLLGVVRRLALVQVDGRAQLHLASAQHVAAPHLWVGRRCKGAVGWWGGVGAGASNSRAATAVIHCAIMACPWGLADITSDFTAHQFLPPHKLLCRQVRPLCRHSELRRRRGTGRPCRRRLLGLSRRLLNVDA